MLSAMFKSILWFLKDQNINKTLLLNIIRTVEPYILFPINLSSGIFEIKYLTSTNLLSNNFMSELIILGIDVQDYCINKYEDNCIIDK